MNDNNKVSVVLCVKNVENDLEECLKSIKQNNYLEIIVVDGKSTDGTVEIAKRFGVDKIISDEGKGLSYARKIGVENSNGEHILFFGPDNIMTESFIDDFLKLKIKYSYDVASVQTRVLQPLTFWDYGLDFRWRCLMGKPGLIKVAGTPSLYSKKCFSTVMFSEDNMGPNDDTQIADKLLKENFIIGLLPLTVYDKNGWSFKDIYSKFKWYGQGDFYFYEKNKINWSFERKFFSATHPLRQMIRYSIKAMFELRVDALLWLFVMTIARYHGWIEKKLN